MSMFDFELDDLIVEDKSTLRDGYCELCHKRGRVLTLKLLGVPHTACVDRMACFKRRADTWKIEEDRRQRVRDERIGLAHLRAALGTDEGRKLAAEIVEIAGQGRIKE